MKKEDVVAAVLFALQEEFRELMKASEEARGGASDDESRAEGKYDTRSTEANYIADGQAKQAVFVEEAAAKFDGADFRDFAEDEAVAVGALVLLRMKGEESWFLLAPAAGGTEVEVDGTAVTVVTPEAPLGEALVGGKAGESVPFGEAVIVSVR